MASAPSYATRVQPPGAFVIVCISRHAVARTGMGPRRRGHRRADLSLGTAQWAQTPPLDDDRSGSPPTTRTGPSSSAHLSDSARHRRRGSSSGCLDPASLSVRRGAMAAQRLPTRRLPRRASLRELPLLLPEARVRLHGAPGVHRGLAVGASSPLVCCVMKRIPGDVSVQLFNPTRPALAS